MRISDWSSDVCSSDLLDHDEGVTPLEPVEQLGRAPGFLRCHAGRRLVHQDELGVLGEQQRDLQPLGLAMGEISGGQAELIAQPDERRRSEEHTSELQSLMRISYAVFCLKKKKAYRRVTRYKATHKKLVH